MLTKVFGSLAVIAAMSFAGMSVTPGGASAATADKACCCTKNECCEKDCCDGCPDCECPHECCVNCDEGCDCTCC